MSEQLIKHDEEPSEMKRTTQGQVLNQSENLAEASTSCFTDGGKEYLRNAVQEYADRLINESRNIEQMEHTGQGDPEITGAHVEEAKWVLIRRLRRSSLKCRWIFTVRIGQAIMVAVVGIGASNFKETWGALMCVGGVFACSILLLVERELTREL